VLLTISPTWLTTGHAFKDERLTVLKRLNGLVFGFLGMLQHEYAGEDLVLRPQPHHSGYFKDENWYEPGQRTMLGNGTRHLHDEWTQLRASRLTIRSAQALFY
jgi:hypothetical protein